MIRPVPIPIHLPIDLFHALTEATGESWFGDKSEAALCEAVSAWLAARGAPAEQHNAPAAGYLWKQLFLPEGTLLRTTFNGQTSHATVEGDTLVCDGQPTSPSRFANQLSSGGRNAWKAIWLRFPQDTAWQRADTARPALRR